VRGQSGGATRNQGVLIVDRVSPSASAVASPVTPFFLSVCAIARLLYAPLFGDDGTRAAIIGQVARRERIEDGIDLVACGAGG
jgi:hypothetical protein